MLPGSSPLIGLDVGSGLLKAVTLRTKGDKISVHRAGILAMPAGAISGRRLLDPPAAGDAARRLLRDLGLRGKRVAVAMAGDEVCHLRRKVERLEVPKMEPRLRDELRQVASFPVDDALLDFEVLDTFADRQWVDVLMVAARRGAVERMQQVVERAGKSAAIVDSTACALANAFEANYQPAANEVTALIHLGAVTLTVCILRGATPLVVLDVTLDAATPWRDQEKPAERVVVELERVLEHMDEIADEHPLEPSSARIGRLLLSGGGIRIRGLEDRLRTRVRIPFEEFNPFRRIEFTGADALSRLVSEQAHCMPVAVGLALRGLDSQQEAAREAAA